MILIYFLALNQRLISKEEAILLFTNVRPLPTTLDILPLLSSILHVKAVVAGEDVCRIHPVSVRPGAGVLPLPRPRGGAGGRLASQPGVGLPHEGVPHEGVLLGRADADQLSAVSLKEWDQL